MSSPFGEKNERFFPPLPATFPATEESQSKTPRIEVSKKETYNEQATKKDTETIEKDIVEAFKQFSASEKLRTQEHQRTIARRDKAIKLNDLKKFAQNFKLHTEVPADPLPILAGKSVSALDPSAPSFVPSTTILLTDTGSLSNRTFSSRQTHSISAESYSTKATTVSRNASSGNGLSGTKLLPAAIAEEQEDSLDITAEEPATGIPEEYESTVSADSIDLTAAQKSHIIAKFSKAILEHLPSMVLIQGGPNVSSRDFFHEFEQLLKEYSVAAKQNAQHRSLRLGSKAIRRLRYEISEHCGKALFAGRRIQEESRIVPTIAQQAGMLHGHMTLDEKFQHWAFPTINVQVSSGDFTNRTEQKNTSSCAPTSVGDAPGDAISWSDNDGISTESEPEATYPASIDDREVYDYLTNHPSFSNLLLQLRECITRFQGTQMENITDFLKDGLQRLPAAQSSVAFVLEWDIIGFLESQYDDGLDQDLGSILTLTGYADNAELRTVRSYIEQTWPENSSSLLNAIKSALLRRAGSYSITQHNSKAASIEVNVEINTFIIREWNGQAGVKFIIDIAQQLAWLTAACRESKVGLAYSVANPAKELPSNRPLETLTIGISSELIPIPTSDLRGCWNNLFSRSVLATGFPTKPRINQEKGLAGPLAVMASLVGIPLAITYAGGYVLKGRFHAFVPIKRRGNTVQWHMIDTWPARLCFNDIGDRCPQRLLKAELSEADLWSTVAVVGWCPKIENVLATNNFEYSSVMYSKAVRPPRRVFELTGGNFGFSKIITANLNVSFGKKDGVHMAARSDFYEGVLDDAQDSHVLLFDTHDRRCWHTTAERFILHIMLHRKMKSPYSLVSIRTADSRDPKSVRAALRQNAGLVVAKDWHREKPEVTDKLFKDSVFELFYLIDGLNEHARNASEKGIKLDLDPSRRLSGWEYRDLLTGKRTIELKAFGLRRSCGHWPELSEDLTGGATVFFGNGFGNVFRPQNPENLCSLFRTVPTEKDYLVVETSMIRGLYEQRISADQDELTATGLRWKQSTGIFEPCLRTSEQVPSTCACERVQELVPKRAFVPHKAMSRMQRPNDIHPHGALIFGKGSSTWLNLKSRFSSQQTNQAVPNLIPARSLPLTPSLNKMPSDAQNLTNNDTLSATARHTSAAYFSGIYGSSELNRMPSAWQQDIGSASIYSRRSAQFGSIYNSTRANSYVPSSLSTNATSISSVGYRPSPSSVSVHDTFSSIVRETGRIEKDLILEKHILSHSMGAGNQKSLENIPSQLGNPTRQPSLPHSALNMPPFGRDAAKGKVSEFDGSFMRMQHKHPQSSVPSQSKLPTLPSPLSEPLTDTKTFDASSEHPRQQTLRKKPKFARSQDRYFAQSSEA